jgi:hypothetical protein
VLVYGRAVANWSLQLACLAWGSSNDLVSQSGDGALVRAPVLGPKSAMQRLESQPEFGGKEFRLRRRGVEIAEVAKNVPRNGSTDINMDAEEPFGSWTARISEIAPQAPPWDTYFGYRRAACV